jgi:hypothetical protein
MATADSLEQIRRHGLLSTDSILSLVEMEPIRRKSLTTERRPQMTPLEHPKHGRFTLRDQKPLRDEALEKCLDGMTVQEWYQSLNSRVFMWANRERVDRLLAAKAYKYEDQLVLTIDSVKLVERHFDNISVSTINSGATLYTPVRRGIQTFIKLKDFPTVKGTKPIAEVTVSKRIPEMADYIIDAEIRKGMKR